MEGLKKLRAKNVDKTPQYDCSNCKCKRYSPCTCMKAYEEVAEADKPSKPSEPTK